jgi:opacity protein-like surface antigen
VKALASALAIAALFCANAVFAQQETDPTRFEQGIGFAAGAMSGSGLSYIYHSDGPWSFQGTGGVWKRPEKLNYNIGVMLRRTLNETRRTRLYLCTGLALYESRHDVMDAAGRKITEVDTHWNTGFGVGVQFFLWDRVGVSLDGDFTFFLNDDQILFLPQGAFQYHF